MVVLPPPPLLLLALTSWGQHCIRVCLCVSRHTPSAPCCTAPRHCSCAGVALGLVLLFFTGFFTHMSKNVQAAIIMVGVLRLFDYKECAFLYRVREWGCMDVLGMPSP